MSAPVFAANSMTCFDVTNRLTAFEPVTHEYLHRSRVPSLLSLARRQMAADSPLADNVTSLCERQWIPLQVEKFKRSRRRSRKIGSG